MDPSVINAQAYSSMQETLASSLEKGTIAEVKWTMTQTTQIV